MRATRCENREGGFGGSPVEGQAAARLARVGDRVASLGAAIVNLYRTWADRARERRELARMSDRELGDISLTRYDARFEARKPFWRP